MKLLPLVFLLVIYSGSSVMEFVPDPDIIDLERAVREARIAKLTERSAKNQRQLTMPDVVEKHVKLARIFNGIYLQNLLSSRRIDYFGVISGLWDLESKTILDKIASLNVDGLLESLTNLDVKIIMDNSNVTKMVDQVAVWRNLDALEKITKETRRKLLKSMFSETIPKYFQVKEDFRQVYLENFKDNLAIVAAAKLKQLETVDNLEPRQKVYEWNTAIIDCLGVFDYLQKWIPQLLADQGTLEPLTKGLEAAETIKSNTKNFKELRDIFQAAETEFGIFRHLQDDASLDNVKSKLNTIGDILQETGQKSKVSPIGSSSEKCRIVVMQSDFDDSFVKNVLNDGNNLGNLWALLEDLKEFSRDFDSLDKNSCSMFDVETPDRLVHVANMIGDIQKVTSLIENLNWFSSCLDFTDKFDQGFLVKVRSLSKSLVIFREGLKKIDTIIKQEVNFDNIYTTLNKALSAFDELMSSRSDQLKHWVNSSDGTKKISEMNTLLTDLSQNIFAKLKQDYTFIRAVNDVLGSGRVVREMESWLKELNFAKPECDSLFSFKSYSLIDLNKFPKALSIFKSRADIYKLKPLLKSLPQIISELKKLKKSGTSGKFGSGVVIRNPGNVIEFESATRRLEAMVKIQKYRNMIEVIVNRGEEARKTVENDPDLKWEYGYLYTWQGFNETKTALTTLQSEIATALSKIPLSGDEKNLEDVGKIYSALINSTITTTPIDLRKYRLTLMKFPNSGSWGDLEHAFAILEKPVSTDFQIVYASFEKIPKALKELQRDLKEFFEGQKPRTIVKVEVENESERLERLVGYVLLALIVVGVVALICWKLKEERDEKKRRRD